MQDELARTRALLEEEFDAAHGSIALVESVCAACNVVLWGIDWRPGDHILVSRSENPGVLASVHALAARFQLAVTELAVSAVDGCVDPVRAVEENIRPETSLAILSHVLAATGETMPVAEIQQRCRARNVMLLVDGAQTAGAQPVSCRRLDLDLYAFSGGKWFCGPSGLAGLYVNPGAGKALVPSTIGWRALGSRTGALHSDARRFELSSLAYPLCAGWREAIELQRRAAPAGERAHAVAVMAQQLCTGLESLSRRVPLELIPTRRGPQVNGIVAFSIAGSRPIDLVRYLETRQVLVREMDSPSCARACTHFFTTRAETDRLLTAVEDFALRQRS
jgi:L-cysteine/cystine lyase